LKKGGREGYWILISHQKLVVKVWQRQMMVKMEYTTDAYSGFEAASSLWLFGDHVFLPCSPGFLFLFYGKPLRVPELRGSTKTQGDSLLASLQLRVYPSLSLVILDLDTALPQLGDTLLLMLGVDISSSYSIKVVTGLGEPYLNLTLLLASKCLLLTAHMMNRRN
jgi:hypothetical protein